MTLPRTLPLLLAALLPLTGIAQNQSCTDTQAEVQRLREQVRTLQAALDAKADAATVPASATLPGTAAKPAPQVRVVVEEPYSHTGCSRGLLKGIAPAQWQDGELWKDLRNGQTPAEVEALLGPEHYDETGGGNVLWHYGRCGKSSMGQVLFTGGQLSGWRAPPQ
jgi:hypothetical protein